MRLVDVSRENPSVLELRWMWLPTFIGQNMALLHKVGKALTEKFVPPFILTDQVREEIDLFVIQKFCEEIKIPGLRKYLEALWEVEE